ncbi:MAG: hypothetical protein J6C82_07865 [Clostridia bacterium]|nr:hypothetical protein [Clostridia bacterium]
MTPLAAAIITVLSVIFIITALECLCRKKVSYILTTSGEIADNIEVRLRVLLKKNPRSEIFVADNSHTDEAKIILEKLSADYPQIHIIRT